MTAAQIRLSHVAREDGFYRTCCKCKVSLNYIDIYVMCLRKKLITNDKKKFKVGWLYMYMYLNHELSFHEDLRQGHIGERQTHLSNLVLQRFQSCWFEVGVRRVDECRVPELGGTVFLSPRLVGQVICLVGKNV